jgi:hypothetical protein
MPLDPNIAMGYRGIEVPNQLAQYAQVQQIQANQRQGEVSQMQLDELKNDRAEMQQFQQQLAAKGGNPDLNAYADMLLKSPKHFKTGIELKQKLKDQSLYEDYLKAENGGGAPVAPAPAMGSAPAPVNAMAPQPVMGGTPTLVNALAPQPVAPVAPVNAMVDPAQTILKKIRMLSASNDPRAKAEVDVLKTQLAEIGKIPTEVREYEYGVANPKFAEYQMKLKKAGGTNVNIDQKQQSAFEAGLGKGQADRIINSQVAAKDAASIIDTVNAGRDIMKSGMITGAGADFLVNLNQGLKTAGIDFGKADAAANSQAFAANMAGNVGKLIKQFGAGTGLSDADRTFATDMAGGRISLDEKAINRILNINEKAARNTIAQHNKDVKGIKTNIPLEVEMPPEVKMPAASNLVTNPKFPGFSIGKP